MPPRVPLLAAIRRPAALLKAPSNSLSTTAPVQILKETASSLLGLDSSSSSSPRGRGRGDATSSVSNMYERIRPDSRSGDGERGTPESNARFEEELRSRGLDEDYSRQLPRRWQIGDVYSPRDMGPGEMSKWRRSQPRKMDLVDMLGLHPLDMYRNFSVISEFVTPHGRIRRSVDTGLRPVNQRKMAKAVRRAIGLGLHPSVHRHPELLKRDAARTYEQNQATANKELKWS